MRFAVILVGALIACLVAGGAEIKADLPNLIYKATSQTLLRTSNASQLYAVVVPNYPAPLLIANITAPTRFQAGYDWGKLLAKENIQNLHRMLNAAFGNDALLQFVFIVFSKLQYIFYAKNSIPGPFLEELDGVRAAMAEADPKYKDVSEIALIMASFPGDIKGDIEHLLENELRNLSSSSSVAATASDLAELRSMHKEMHRRIREWAASSARPREYRQVAAHVIRVALEKATRAFRRSCSHFGVWGSRTLGGSLFAGRNLDYLAKSGITNSSLITFMHLPSVTPTAMVGFAALYGGIAGASKAGMFVSESGNDNDDETLRGFSWTLRLRALMEANPPSTAAMRAWMRPDQNTMGMNHGIGVATRFMELETKQGYTAFFADNDTREANFVVNRSSSNCDASGEWIPGSPPCHRVGAPMPEAVWRTNHGYDPTWLSTAMFGRIPGHDTFTRYMLISEMLKYYEREKIMIGLREAVNLTAAPADKGTISNHGPFAGFKRLLTCPAGPSGSNIVSVTFQSSGNVTVKLLVAFEIFTPPTFHGVAACNGYLDVDLASFW